MSAFVNSLLSVCAWKASHFHIFTLSHLWKLNIRPELAFKHFVSSHIVPAGLSLWRFNVQDSRELCWATLASASLRWLLKTEKSLQTHWFNLRGRTPFVFVRRQWKHNISYQQVITDIWNLIINIIFSFLPICTLNPTHCTRKLDFQSAQRNFPLLADECENSSVVSNCTYFILHGEARTFDSRSKGEKKEIFLSGETLIIHLLVHTPTLLFFIPALHVKLTRCVLSKWHAKRKWWIMLLVLQTC